MTICEKSGYFIDGNLPFLSITSGYMAPVACTICIIYILNFKIATAIFLSIPVAKNEMFIMNKKYSDCTHHHYDAAFEQDKIVQEREMPPENNSSQKKHKKQQTFRSISIL